MYIVKNRTSKNVTKTVHEQSLTNNKHFPKTLRQQGFGYYGLIANLIDFIQTQKRYPTSLKLLVISSQNFPFELNPLRIYS